MNKTQANQLQIKIDALMLECLNCNAQPLIVLAVDLKDRNCMHIFTTETLTIDQRVDLLHSAIVHYVERHTKEGGAK